MVQAKGAEPPIDRPDMLDNVVKGQGKGQGVLHRQGYARMENVQGRGGSEHLYLWSKAVRFCSVCLWDVMEREMEDWRCSGESDGSSTNM